MRRITLAVLLFIYAGTGMSQVVTKGEQAEHLWYSNEKLWKLRMQTDLNATRADLNQFLSFNQHEYFSDRASFFRKALKGSQDNDSAIIFFNNLESKYTKLYAAFSKVRANNPGYIQQQINQENDGSFHKPDASCNPSCNNIGFENGNLSGWNACYASNTSSSSTDFSTTVFTCSGVLGNVTNAAYDPNTGSTQVTTIYGGGGGYDPVVGPALPLVSAQGGKYSARVGDGVTANYGVAQLSNSFIVSDSTPILTLQYAVVLENPNHTYSQQPWFQMQVLDQNGHSISTCGQYFIVSGSGVKGFKGVYYTPNADSVYYKPWTTVYVPLYKYVGQCVTVVFRSADCALGAHFGYAYVDASCSRVGAVSSSPAYCGQKEIKLTAPAGSPVYAWSGPCISGPANQQTVNVNCAGTYSVIAGDKVAGCIDTLSVKVNSVTGTIPVPLFTFDTVCQGKPTAFTNKSTPISGSGLKYYWDYYSNGRHDDSTTSPTFIFPAAGTYNVTLSENIGGCSVDTTLKVLVPTSVATIKGKVYHCFNGPADTLVATSGEQYYTWSTGSTQSSIAVIPTSTTVYSVKTVIGSCASAASFTVTPDPVINVGISSITNVTCNGSCNGKALATGSGGTSPYTYLWHTLPMQASQSATDLCAGRDTVIITDAVGCSNSGSVVISQPTSVLSVLSSQINVNCNGAATGSAWLKVSGGNAPYKYSWSPTGGTKDTAIGLKAGVYTVTVLDNSSNCVATVIDIKQPAALLTTPNITPPLCGLSDGQINIGVSGGTAPYTYSWSPSVSTSDSATNLAAGVYLITVSDAHGCKALHDSIVLNSIGSILVLNAHEVTCYGTKTGYATATLTGGTTPYKYLWSPGGNTSATDSLLAAGNYTVTLTDSIGCKASSAFIITQPLTLTVSMASTGTCPGVTVGTATATPSGGTSPYTYSWSPVSGTTYKITNLATGNYTVAVKDVNGCKAGGSVAVVKLPPLRDSIVTSTSELCAGNCNAFAVAGVKNGTAPYTFVWSNGKTGAKDSNLCAGGFKVNITDTHGCKDSASVTITQPRPITDSITTFKNELCFGNCNAFAIAGVKYGTAPYSFLWSNGGKGSKDSNLCVGNYTVNVTDKNGCKGSAIASVTAPTQITAKASAINATCNRNNGSAAVIANGGTTGYTYQWSAGGQTTQSINNLGSGIYSVTVSDANGCNVVTTVTVNTTSAISISVCCDTTIATGQSVTLSVNPSSSYTYLWSPSTGLSCVVCPNPVANPASSTTYYVTVKDTAGCTAIDSVLIQIMENSLHIYNGFTPNGDGKDDYWKIGGIESFPDNSVGIYNRWGAEVWKATGYNNGTVSWTGLDEQGQPLPSATYYYLLTVNGTKYKGWIQLMR